MEAIKIAIADDNKSFCSLMKDFFDATEDLQVTAMLHDGNEVLEYIQNHRVDVLLLDIVMPNLDGLGVLQYLKSHKEVACPKIIALSALCDDRVTKRAVDLGADYFVAKPIDIYMLTERIREQVTNPDILSIQDRQSFFKKEISAAPTQKRTYSSNLIEFDNHLTVDQFTPTFDSKQSSSSAIDIQRAVSKMLHDVGVPAHVKGYLFLKEGVSMILSNVELIGSVTKEIYPVIADKYNTSPTRVERAIRHAIEIAWTRGQLEFQHELFGFTINMKKGKPTNSEFLAMLADKLRLDLEILA